MNREQLYNIYQTNLELLENELVQVKGWHKQIWGNCVMQN